MRAQLITKRQHVMSSLCSLAACDDGCPGRPVRAEITGGGRRAEASGARANSLIDTGPPRALASKRVLARNVVSAWGATTTRVTEEPIEEPSRVRVYTYSYAYPVHDDMGHTSSIPKYLHLWTSFVLLKKFMKMWEQL
jgi:hypothetical protein